VSRLDGSRRAELAAALFLLVFAVAGYFAVPTQVSGWVFSMPGTTDNALTPTFFPLLAMVLLGLTVLGVLVTTPYRRGEIPLLATARDEWRRMGLVTALVLLYIGGIVVIGFIVASMLFIAVTALALGYRSNVTLAVTAIVVPLATAIAFRFGLRVILPAGYLGLGF